MSQLIIDASVVLNWLLPDEEETTSREVRDELLTAECVWVPAHWRLEVSNALCMAERRKRLNSAGVAQAVALFAQIPVSIDPETNARATAESLSLARQHKLSVYDSAYLELALRRGAKLASLDEPLREVAKKVSVAILPKRLA